MAQLERVRGVQAPDGAEQALGVASARFAPPAWLISLAAYALVTAWLFRELLPKAIWAMSHGPDAPLYLWNVWWAQRAIWVEHTSPYFTRWIFFPDGIELWFHSFQLSALLPFLPIAAAGGPHGVVLAHNLTVLTSFVLSGLFVYLLAFDETRSHLGAWVAGAIFAFSAIRLHSNSQTDLLSTQFLVLYVFLLLRTLRRQPALATAAGFCLAFLAYDSLTLLVFGLLLTGPLVLMQPRRRQLAFRIALVLGIGTVLMAPLLWNTLVAGARWNPPSRALVDAGGIDPRMFVMPHHWPSRLDVVPALLFGGDWTALAGASLPGLWMKPPIFLYGALGYTLLALSLLSALVGRERRRWFWLALGIGALVLSLGPYLRLGERVLYAVPLPYRLLRDLPGFAMSVAHYRYITPALLGLSIFAAFGVAACCEPRPGEARTVRLTRLAGGLAAALLVLAEQTSVSPSLVSIGPAPFARRLAEDAGDFAVLHYPPGRTLHRVELQMLQQIFHRKRLLGGYLARIPKLKWLPGDPMNAVLPGAPPASSTREALDLLQSLFREPRYRIKYLVVSSDDFSEARDAQPLLDALAARYPLVTPHAEEGSWLFYVGAETFDSEGRALADAATRLAANPCSATREPEGAGSAKDLLDAWQGYQASATEAERGTPRFRETAAEIRNAQAQVSGCGG